jgi:hypothetical protein
MSRVCLTVAAAALSMAAVLSADTQDQPKAVPATPENVASFLGEWTITANGSYGEANEALTLKVADGKVTGDISDANGQHALTSISTSGTNLVFTYVFDYQGMTIDAVVTLTPNEKKVDAVLDFASGAAQFVGTATKKEAPKG